MASTALGRRPPRRGARRLLPADVLIWAGFWSQLVLLLLVDWGTLSAFANQRVSPIHYVGFAVVNGLLLGATALTWRWLRVQRSPPMPR